MIRDIFPKPNVRETPPPVVQTSNPQIKEIPVKGGQVLQHNFINFQPSLSDPRRPAVHLVSETKLRGSNKFSAPAEFTPIDTAILGQAPVIHTIQQKRVNTYATPQEQGKLKVPKETTPIDEAVFSSDIYSRLPKTRTNTTNQEIVIKENAIDNSVSDSVIVLKNSKLRVGE